MKKLTRRLIVSLLTKILNQLPLRTVLTIPFVAQVIGVVGVVGYLSFQNGQATVNDLASQLRSELTGRILQQIQTVVERPYIINQINANSLLQGDLNVTTGEGEHQLWQQARVFPSTNLIYCATEADGAFLGVGRFIDSNSEMLRIQASSEATDYYFYYYEADSFGNRSFLRSQGVETYDPRLRPWYQKAKAQRNQTWSDIYLDFDTKLPTITANTPIYNSNNGEILGVCATDIILSQELNEFLQELKISETGIAFIVNPAGSLLASSTADPIISGTGENSQLLAAKDSDNPLIQGITNRLDQTHSGLGNVESAQHVFRLEGQRQYIQVVRFNDPHGLDWIVVLVVPENDFMARINSNTQITIILCVVALLVTVFIGLLITQWLTQPLLRLSVTAKDIANGKWHSVSDVDRADVIGDLSRSFSTMTQELQASFKNLETRVDDRTTELTRLNQELRKLSRIDDLTQTANRRSFNSHLEHEWQRLLRDQQPLTLLLCDVDYFKKYNDTYGHQEGDRCLQTIANVLLAAARRPADFVARYGGEEFTITMPNTAVDGGVHVAVDIIQALNDMQIPHAASHKKQVTVSIGIATIVPNKQTTPEAFVNLADRALYAAKSKGRDRYCIATHHFPPEVL